MAATENSRTTTDPCGLLGEQVGRLKLRLTGLQEGQRDVLLSSAKETIGSGPDCTVHIDGPGVSAVHCLILQGENGNVARSWAPFTLLNGRILADASLRCGDRLSLGSVNVQVLEDGTSTSPPSRQSTDAIIDTEDFLVQSLRDQIAQLQTELADQ